MASGIIRLTHSKSGEPYYFTWSSACDAPSSRRMSREELAEFLDGEDIRTAGAHWLLDDRYGQHIGPEAREAAEEKLAFLRHSTAQRLKRLDERGTSYLDESDTGEQFAAFNRAGENESCITPDEIIERYAGRQG